MNLSEWWQKSTVRIQVGNTHGTGFFVTNGLILTCAHVVKDAGSQEIKAYWQDLSFLVTIQELRSEFHLDLAWLQFSNAIPGIVGVELDAEDPQLGDALYAYGYPQSYSEGDSATFEYEGESLKNDSPLYKLKAGQVDFGLSGAPLFNQRTGKVCGIVNLSRQTNSDLGGRAVPVKVIFSQLPELKALNQQFQLQKRQRTGINPFGFGNPVSPDRFYGRERAILDVKNRIGAISPQCINIVGMRRNGKTSLLHYIKEQTEIFCPSQQKSLIVSLDLQAPILHSPAGILEGLRRGIKKSTGTEPWTRNGNNDPYEIEDGLAALRDNGQRLIILFDEFEAIGKKLELFQDWGDDWRAKASAGLLTIVIASKRPLDEIYQILNIASPFSNIFSQTVLGTFEIDAWHQLVQDGVVDVSAAEIELIDDLAGGLPFYVQMAAALLWQYGDFKEVQQEFCKQATPRFRELWHDLTVSEQQILKNAANHQVNSGQSNPIVATLQLHGLLRADGRLFSSALTEFIRHQR